MIVSGTFQGILYIDEVDIIIDVDCVSHSLDIRSFPKLVTALATAVPGDYIKLLYLTDDKNNRKFITGIKLYEKNGA